MTIGFAEECIPFKFEIKMSLTNVFQLDGISSTSSESSDLTLPHDDTIIESLGSYEFDVRLQLNPDVADKCDMFQTINGLSTIAKRDPQWFLKFLRKGELVKQLEILLDDERWEVQHQTVKFLHDALPTFGNNTEFCMSYLLSAIVMKLSSSKLTVRRITNHLLTVYLKINPNIVLIVQKVIVNYLTQPVVDADAQYTMLNEIPNLFITECNDKNWQILTDGLVKVAESTSSRNAKKAVEVQKLLEAFLKKDKLKTPLNFLNLEDGNAHENASIFDKKDHNDIRLNMASSNKRYRFRVIPEELFNTLQPENDPATKIAGLEQIKLIMANVSAEDIRKIVPHLHSYFVALGKVLEDPDENIKFNCLEIIKLSIHKFVGHLDDHVQVISFVF
uniref:HEAT repeat-containing protein 1 n=1 Tax=Syphacia muris TaxID=451379 RepID=A0A158R4G6_9BILA